MIFQAETLYENTLEKHRFEPWFTKDSAIKYLEKELIWPQNGDKQIKDLEEGMDNLKLKLYESVFSHEEQKQIRFVLHKVKERYYNLISKRDCIFENTIEGFAQKTYNEFIFANSVVDYDNNRLWKTIEDVSLNLFFTLYNIYIKESLGNTELRELARTEPWRSHWVIYKPTVFSRPLNEEQRSLILFSQMYDGVHSSSECPTDEVINDDDMLDGWFIYQRKQRDQQLKEINAEKVANISNKYNDAQEVFVLAKSKVDINRINDMNHPVSRAAKRSREKIIKHKKDTVVTDLEFPDVKQDISMQRAQSLKDKRHG